MAGAVLRADVVAADRTGPLDRLRLASISEVG
jgi:hypothetical protein